MEGFPKDLIELMDELTTGEFFKLALYKLSKAKIETDTEIEDLGDIIDKATDLYEDIKLKKLTPELRAEFFRIISERGMTRPTSDDSKKKRESTSAPQEPELFESEPYQVKPVQQPVKQKEASPIHRRQYRNRSRSPPSAYRARSRSRPRIYEGQNKFDGSHSPEKKDIGTPRRNEDSYGQSSRKSPPSYYRARSRSRPRVPYESQSKYETSHEKNPPSTPRRNEEPDILSTGKNYSALSKKMPGQYKDYY